MSPVLSSLLEAAIGVVEAKPGVAVRDLLWAGPNADKLLLLPAIISKEPLGPFVRKGDDKWFDIVRWTHFAMLEAEELGLTSATVDAAGSSTSPDVRRLPGSKGELGKRSASITGGFTTCIGPDRPGRFRDGRCRPQSRDP